MNSYSTLVLSGGPLYYWNFNEASGNALNQVGYPGLPQDQLIPQGQASRVPQTAGGPPLGYAASFNGSGTGRFYLADLSISADLAGPWAVELWLQQFSPALATYLLEGQLAGGGVNYPSLIQGFTGAGVLELFGGGDRTGAGGPVLSSAGWHHLVFGYFGSAAGDGVSNRQDIYVDGVLASSVSGSSAQFPSALPFGSLGMALGGTWEGSASEPIYHVLNGFLDEFAIYNLSGAGSVSAVAARVATLAGHYQQAFALTRE